MIKKITQSALFHKNKHKKFTMKNENTMSDFESS